MRLKIAALLLACCTTFCTTFCTAFTAAAGNDPFAQGSKPGNPFASSGSQQFLLVGDAYQLEPHIVDDILVLQWQVAPAYYLYRHGFKFRLGEQDLTSQVEIPVGLAREDDYFGKVEVYYDAIALRLPKSALGSAGTLAVASQGCADAGLCYPPQTQQVQFNFADANASVVTRPTTSEPSSTTAPPVANNPPAGSPTLLLALLLAFAGGLILNLMPCVLPVLTLKAISFANDHSARHRIQQGWAYSAGVVSSFVLIATVLIVLKSAGQAIGWGFQLQSPWFVGALVYLFFALGLVLAGNLSPGASLMGLGQGMTQVPGFRGSFFTGVLATTVASPCTAPFMGTALGFAISQPWFLALSIFAALGAGMAFPFLALSYLPKLQGLLPKPGLWMERFKELLAFPLFATAIWLISVLNSQAGGSSVTLILCGCLLIGLGAWLSGKSFTSRLMRWIAVGSALALLASPPLLNEPGRSTAVGSVDNLYSPARLQALRAANQAVFINVTADWCITCIANERVALSSSRVQQALREHQVTYLEADWTRYDPAISALLEQFQRSGIPLYLLYPADNTRDAIILPQILSPATILDALAQL